MAGMLQIDIKGAFDHVSRSCLLQTMENMDADDELMRWTESFMLDRIVSLVIHRHLCEEIAVETRVSQGSPVSLVLIAIYLCGVFREVEKEVEVYIAMPFADDCKWLIVVDSVEHLCERLERARITAVE